MNVRAPIRYDEPVRLLPGVTRLTQSNEGLFSGPGTNTHLLGFDELYVLDPGEDRRDGHLERIVAAVGGRKVLGILPSHGHPDHWPLAPALAQRLDAPILFQHSSSEFGVQRVVADGEVLRGHRLRLEVLHTPGHAVDHVCVHWAEIGVLLPGDHVMGWSTSIIAPPYGNLNQYLSSLRRLQAVAGLRYLLPAHGEAITEPYQRMEELLQHRHQRTEQVLAALREGPARIGELVARIYHDVDPRLHPAAARSMWAHLLALEESNTVRREAQDGSPQEAPHKDSGAADPAAIKESFEAVSRARWHLS